MVRTLLISRAAASRNWLVVLQLEELRVEAGQRVDHGREDGHGRRVRGEALEVVLHALVQQLACAVSCPRNGAYSSWVGSLPKISSQATSMKLGLSANCSMGMPR